jgi:hypothetical protein
MAEARHHNAPPPVLDCARVIAYAVLDGAVEFSGRSLSFVDGKEVGAVPRLAICEDLASLDTLLFHCAADWSVLGCSAHNSIAAAKSRAESIYHGVSNRWVDTNVSRAAAEAYLDELFEGQKCGICGKRPYQVESYVQRGAAWICDRCAG